MSIDLILKELLSSGRLFELRSMFTGDETARSMIVSGEVLAAVTPPFPETEEGRRLGEFRGWLDSFLEGGELSVAENPDRKPPDAMLARVHPVEAEFWSIRVTLPEDTPGIRAFGAFAEKDKFLVLTWDKRELIGDEFNDAVNEVRSTWFSYFQTEKPFSGVSLDDYLTNYIAV